MSTKPFKRTQVAGERYILPGEDVEVEKLVKKGLGLEKRLQEIKNDLEEVKGRLTEIATARRQESTTVNLQAISGKALVTFRESWACDSEVEDLAPELKDLFPSKLSGTCQTTTYSFVFRRLGHAAKVGFRSCF